MTPAVTVLLAVHNGQRYLEDALRSIMVQTLRDIEILVVDDCSDDDTPAILARLAAEDTRIRVLRAPENLRLAGALNHGLDHARGAYVARMDDDDFSFPERLDIEKRFLDAHPDITLVGSSIEWMDEDGRSLRRSVRARDSFAVRWTVRFFLNVSHPTFMFRRTLPDGTPLRYDRRWRLTEDHDFVCRLLQAGGQVVCLPDVLLRYRFHAKSVSRSKFHDQMAEAAEIGAAFQRAELPDEIYTALAPLRACYFHFAPATPDQVAGAFRGAMAMLAHDIARHPERAAWLRRQTAQFLVWALGRGNISKPALAGAFLRHAPTLIPALGLRLLETKGLLPGFMNSDPLQVTPGAGTGPRAAT